MKTMKKYQTKVTFTYCDTIEAESEEEAKEEALAQFEYWNAYDFKLEFKVFVHEEESDHIADDSKKVTE